MSAYACYLYEQLDGVPHMELLDAADDAEALDRARLLLRKAGKRRLAEVWEDARRVGVLERETA